MTDWEDLTGRSRHTGTDTAHERTAVGPAARTYHKQSPEATGFTSQMAGVLAGDVMERAMADKMKLVEESQDLAIARGEEAEEEKKTKGKDIDDADDDLDAIRARRLTEMKRRAEEHKEMQAKGHGTYEEITQDEFLPTVTGSYRCIVHFYHRSFERSKIMDMHLKKMAKKFFRTRFVKIDAEKAPFFVTKLQIQTLPTACAFINGVRKYHQVGFDGLGGDEFKTGHLARMFLRGVEESSDSAEKILEEDFDSDGDLS